MKEEEKEEKMNTSRQCRYGLLLTTRGNWTHSDVLRERGEAAVSLLEDSIAAAVLGCERRSLLDDPAAPEMIESWGDGRMHPPLEDARIHILQSDHGRRWCGDGDRKESAGSCRSGAADETPQIARQHSSWCGSQSGVDEETQCEGRKGKERDSEREGES